MMMTDIIKNSVGKQVNNKLTKEKAVISGVEENTKNEIIIFVSSSEQLEKLTFIEFVTKYEIDFTL
jgi:hypothetical protein